MDERKVSAEYVNVLAAIKDQIAVNVGEQAKKRGLDLDATRILIYTAQSTVDTVGVNGFSSIFKAAESAAQEAFSKKGYKS